MLLWRWGHCKVCLFIIVFPQQCHLIPMYVLQCTLSLEFGKEALNRALAWAPTHRLGMRHKNILEPGPWKMQNKSSFCLLSLLLSFSRLGPLRLSSNDESWLSCEKSSRHCCHRNVAYSHFYHPPTSKNWQCREKFEPSLAQRMKQRGGLSYRSGGKRPGVSVKNCGIQGKRRVCTWLTVRNKRYIYKSPALTPDIQISLKF